MKETGRRELVAVVVVVAYHSDVEVVGDTKVSVFVDGAAEAGGDCRVPHKVAAGSFRCPQRNNLTSSD
jgi:hypothetical protein